MESSGYQFGDSNVAAERLQILAETFAESTRPFLREAASADCGLAIDLGCGPGFTTQLLADTTHARHIAGLDSSQHYIDLARRTASDGVEFVLHDVTSVPFPTGTCDLIYCRFLLTHIQDPRSTIREWATQLERGGLLLVEEVEWINTHQPVLSEYIEILAASLNNRSQSLYVGPDLDNLMFDELLLRRHSDVRRLQVSNSRAATMFSMNIKTWKNEPYVVDNYPPGKIDYIEGSLESIAEGSNGLSEIEWGMRQIVWKRT